MALWNTRFQELADWDKDHPGEQPPMTQQEREMIFGKGELQPFSGAHVIPLNKLSIDKSKQSIIRKNIESLKSKGYLERFDVNAKNLNGIEAIAEDDFKGTDGAIIADESTHMRHYLSDLKMAYVYGGVPVNLINKSIGYAPESTYTSKGWAGVVQFFIPQSINAKCAFHEIDIRITGSSTLIPEETVSKIIPDKISFMNVSGNLESGYIYTIEWWDTSFRRSLECGLPDYSDDNRNALIKLAQDINKPM